MMIKPILLIVGLIAVGMIGYMVLEGWDALDGLYMTVITIFTVGFHEVRALSTAGRIFTLVLIIGGVGTALYVFTQVAEIVFEGGVNAYWRKRHMDKNIRNLKGHYIVCGYGRMGKLVSERLAEEKAPFVVIESDEDKVEDAREEGSVLIIEGDATKEEVLLVAGIKEAKALAALLPTDADNLYVVMTARQLNPSAFLLSKVVEEEAERKILQVGANRTVSPYTLSGLKIAQSLMRPTLVDFMDLIIRRTELSLYTEEFIVGATSPLVGRTLADCDIRRTTNVIVVATKKPQADIQFNPTPTLRIETGDTLLVMGIKEDVLAFERMYIAAS
jgi:voltage-gated potassium channel